MFAESPSASGDSTGGHGLNLVTALTTAWGFKLAGTGKVVWAGLAADGLPTF